MTSPANDEQLYVDDRDLAKRTPIARVTWQTYRAKGIGPNYFKIGRRCLYRWADVVAWLETHRTMTKAG